MAKRHELVDVECRLHHETDKGLFVSPAEKPDRKTAVWLAKSQVEFEYKTPAVIIVTMPASIAQENGLEDYAS
jgi:hypothetical protein